MSHIFWWNQNEKKLSFFFRSKINFECFFFRTKNSNLYSFMTTNAIYCLVPNFFQIKKKKNCPNSNGWLLCVWVNKNLGKISKEQNFSQNKILSYHNHNNNNDQHRMTWKLEIFIGKIYFIHFSKCKTNIVLQGNICNVVVVDIILVYVIDYHQYCCYRFSCCCCCCCLKKNVHPMKF